VLAQEVVRRDCTFELLQLTRVKIVIIVAF
jgi:hypothetical protein